MAGCFPLMAQKGVFNAHWIACLDHTHGSLVFPRQQHQLWIHVEHVLDRGSIAEIAHAYVYIGEAAFPTEALLERGGFKRLG